MWRTSPNRNRRILSFIYKVQMTHVPHIPLSWDATFMTIANAIAQRSKDPKAQVGACIVDDDNRVVGLGYNGFPRRCRAGAFPWTDRAPHAFDTKYMYVVHAELNAILNSSVVLRGCTLYTTRFPCNECTKAIIQAGIQKVVFCTMKHIHSASVLASIRMLAEARIEACRMIIPNIT